MKTHALEVGDHRSHPAPPGADPSWQDAWLMVWCDPVQQAGGFHHVDLRHEQKKACAWSWVGARGQVLGHYENLEMDLPDIDLSELTLGPMSITTREPFKSFQLVADHGDARAEIQVDGYTLPPAFDYQTGGMSLAPSHYEAIGSASGTLSVHGDLMDIQGYAIHDHSWGPRDYGTIRTHRFIWAAFGPDLYLAVMTMASDETRRDLGWIYTRGEFQSVVKVQAGARMDDDGLTPTGADTRFWTSTGEGYHLTSRVHTAACNTHEGDYFMSVGLADFELGGRLGAGMVETQESARPAIAQRRELARRDCR